MITKQQTNGACLVVLSGGQDSTTCLYWAKQHYSEVHAITFDYGQRHARELTAAKIVAAMAGVASHEVVTVGPILKGRSPLTNPAENLELYEDADQMSKVIGDRLELTFVPMRNALFLALAANYAVCKDIYTLVTGVCQEDTANYPDCRQVFIDHQEYAINHALGLDTLGQRYFSIETPLMTLTKAQTVKLAIKLPGCMDALAHTHTAYSGDYPPKIKDHATVLRAAGFAEANVPDPLVVRAWQEGLMPLPETANYDILRGGGLS